MHIHCLSMKTEIVFFQYQETTYHTGITWRRNKRWRGIIGGLLSRSKNFIIDHVNMFSIHIYTFWYVRGIPLFSIACSNSDVLLEAGLQQEVIICFRYPKCKDYGNQRPFVPSAETYSCSCYLLGMCSLSVFHICCKANHFCRKKSCIKTHTSDMWFNP